MFWSLNAGSGRARCAGDWLGGPPGQTEIRAARGEGTRRSQEAFCESHCHRSVSMSG